MMPDLSPARCDHLKTVSVRTRNTSALLVSFTPPTSALNLPSQPALSMLDVPASQASSGVYVRPRLTV